MYKIYAEKYRNDYTRKNVEMSFISLNEIFEYLKDISCNFSNKYDNRFPQKKNYNDNAKNWPGRISVSDEKDNYYTVFWIHQIESQNGIVFSDGKFTRGEHFCAKSVEEWLNKCHEEKNKKFNFVEE